MRSATSNLVLLSVSSVVCLLVLEITVRLLGLSEPSVGRVDAVRGWALRPGVTATKSREGGSVVSINSDGLRDDEHPRERPADTFRIAVLGDSFTLASHVDLEETFWSILERRLASCPALAGLRVETINFGVTGYGTAQEFIALRDQALAYEPQLVLLAAYTGNDVRNNSRALARDRLRPFFEFVDGDLVLDASFADSAAYRRKRWNYAILYRSRLAQVVKGILLGLGSEPVATTTLESLRNSADVAIYCPPEGDAWRAAWDVTDALLGAIHEEAGRHGAAFAVATLSNPIQVYPNAAERASLMDELGVCDPWYPDRAFEAIGERHGFPVIALAPAMSEEAGRSGRYFHGFSNTLLGIGHWNEDGHAVASEILAPALCRVLENGAGDPGGA